MPIRHEVVVPREHDNPTTTTILDNWTHRPAARATPKYSQVPQRFRHFRNTNVHQPPANIDKHRKISSMFHPQR